MYYLYKVPK